MSLQPGDYVARLAVNGQVLAKQIRVEAEE